MQTISNMSALPNTARLMVVAQDIALPTDITEETVLTLPAVHTKDGETVNIEWSSKDIAITDNTVKLTLPESG